MGLWEVPIPRTMSAMTFSFRVTAVRETARREAVSRLDVLDLAKSYHKPLI
jgi:hypothetical protein